MKSNGQLHGGVNSREKGNGLGREYQTTNILVYFHISDDCYSLFLSHCSSCCNFAFPFCPRGLFNNN